MTKKTNQFNLLRTKRFLPFFCTQFLGAFNDNLFKNALILFIAFEAVHLSTIDTDILNNLAQGLFILPFFLFSALAGQLADKFDKSRMTRWLKVSEMFFMGLAAVAFYLQSVWGLLFVLFLMGMQSAFFSPVKYSIIPQALKETELVSGNAFVEMGTFLAILFGTAAAGLILQADNAATLFAGCVCLFAVLGWLSSLYIPATPPQDSGIKIKYNPLPTTWEMIKYAASSRTVFQCILGISWFWFLGASYLTQLPNYTIEALGAQSSVVTLLLCVFSVGIGVGSLICDRLSGHKIEIGIVPFGSLGLSIFGFDLMLASDFPAVDSLRNLTEFLMMGAAYRVLLDIAMIGVFGGLFIVPLYATIQQRTESGHLARVIAANSVLNSLLMVLAALNGILLLGIAEIGKPQYFGVLAVMNMAVAIFIYVQVPEFGMRFIVWLMGHSIYRVRHENLEAIPEQGGVVLVCNHVSYVDALLLGGAVRRPIRFVMFKSIYDLPILNFVFRTGRAIPITYKIKDPGAYDSAFAAIAEALAAGDVICIFPEGQLTRDGEVGEFKAGIEKIVMETPVPVVPMALKGLWGSIFSHWGAGAFRRIPRRFWPKIDIIAGNQVLPGNVSAIDLRERVKKLMSS